MDSKTAVVVAVPVVVAARCRNSGGFLVTRELLVVVLDAVTAIRFGGCNGGACCASGGSNTFLAGLLLERWCWLVGEASWIVGDEDAAAVASAVFTDRTDAGMPLLSCCCI
jgi:hypothetical protein